MTQNRLQLDGKQAVPRTRKASAAGLIFCLAAVVCGGTDANDHQHHPSQAHQASPKTEAERQALLLDARAALAVGDSASALNLLDAAAAISHSADTELLTLQAQMQAGDYRGALMFASHTAGAHLHEPDALALYVWMLALGEQRVEARRLLDAGLKRLPDNALLQAMQQQLARTEAGATPELAPQSARVRPGPVGVGATVPTEAQVAGSGLLLGGGRLALVGLASGQANAQLWVRNGLGQASKARLVQSVQSLGLALLSLEAPLSLAQSTLHRAPRNAFAGSAATAFTLLAAPTPQPAWPAMYRGFLGRVSASSQYQDLGLDLPVVPNGGPVFDQAGRWIGISLASADGAPKLAPLSALQAALGSYFDTIPVQPQGSPLALDQQYEQALPLTVQVLVRTRANHDPQSLARHSMLFQPKFPISAHL